MRVSLLALSLLLAAPAGAQHHHMDMPPPAATDRLGDVVFANSGKPAAQSDFIEGVKRLHNFEYEDAIAAFQRA